MVIVLGNRHGVPSLNSVCILDSANTFWLGKLPIILFAAMTW